MRKFTIIKESINSNMKHWKIIVISLILIINGQNNFNKTNISERIIKLIEKISDVNIVMSKAVGYAGVRPEQYNNFDKLKKLATIDELKELIKHQNPTVRCYAFWALTYNHSINFFPIILDHINDTAYVHTQFGCIIGQERVGDFFIKVVTPQQIDKNCIKMDSTQLVTLDSILLYLPNKLTSKLTAINRIKPEEHHYKRIKELVTTENNQDALVTLAKFQREQDISIILGNRADSKFAEGGYFHTYRAIKCFPHLDFLPLLEKNLNKTFDNTHFSNEWQELYKAIASYKNHKAVELLKLPFTKVKHTSLKTYHLDFVYSALIEFKDHIYDNLLWKLWVEKKRVTPDIFNYLFSINSDRTYELTKSSLDDMENFFDINSSFIFKDQDASKNMILSMITLILKQDNELGYKLIKKNIKNANVHLFPIFAEKVTELKDTVFVEDLFERFEIESNAHIYLKIAETLLAYNNAIVERRILDSRKKNRKLRKGWGGKALTQLLKDNGLFD